MAAGARHLRAGGIGMAVQPTPERPESPIDGESTDITAGVPQNLEALPKIAQEVWEARDSAYKASVAVKNAEDALSIDPDVKELLREAQSQLSQAEVSARSAYSAWKSRLGMDTDMPDVHKHVLKTKVSAERASEIARSVTVAILQARGEPVATTSDTAVQQPVPHAARRRESNVTRDNTAPKLVGVQGDAVPLQMPEESPSQPSLLARLFAPLAFLRPPLAAFFSHEGLAKRLITALVLLPAGVVFLYLLLWASPMYISEARFAVRGQNAAPSMNMMSSLFSGVMATLGESYIVQDYIGSLDMVEKLDARLHLREHYADRSHDFWFRLWGHATQDEVRDYWQWAVTTSFDPDTAILSVQVKAFSPDMALALCRGILDNSEALVNAMNERAREDAISQARQEVARAEQRVREAREASRAWRERTVILDPEATATGLYSVVNNLEGQVTKTAAELAEAQTYMKKDSPRVAQLRNKLAVLQKQLAAEKERLAGEAKTDVPLSSILSEYQRLTLEEEFAQKQLTSAMSSLETARVKADAKSLYIEPFERPVLADESLYPRPVYFTFIYMVTSLLLLGLVSLIIAAVREHTGF